jgi:hypothetical protein
MNRSRVSFAFTLEVLQDGENIRKIENSDRALPGPSGPERWVENPIWNFGTKL